MALRRTPIPGPTPVQPWVDVVSLVAKVVFFVGWVWVKAPARAFWRARLVRVLAWLFLVPVGWWLMRTAVRVAYVVGIRWPFGPLVAVFWGRMSGRADVRDVVRAARQGRRRGRREGRRVARRIYGAGVLS